MPEDFEATRTSVNTSRTAPATPETKAHYAADSSACFGPYRLLKSLGEGGMGQVWEAEHRDTSRIVALKIAHSGLSSEADRERFIREARLAASISHRNCVFVFGAVESNGAIAIAMELVRGGTARDLVRDGKPIAPQEAVRIAIETIDGLEAAQAKGILHCDIKPANIFIDSDTGAAKVGDFGLSTRLLSAVAAAVQASSDVSTTASFAGTPSYASPEQLQGRTLDVRSDIYSVGATLYYLLAGRPPFAERDLITLVASIAGRNPDPPSRHNPHVPPDIDAVVLKCLAKDPADRYEDYAALRDALVSEAPAPPSRRLLAGVIDSFLSDGLLWPLSSLLWAGSSETPGPQLILLLVRASVCLSFGALEGVKGWSPGKLAFGLHVRNKLGPPGLRTGLLRSSLFFLCQYLPTIALLCFLGFTRGWQVHSAESSEWLPWTEVVFVFAPFVTARRSNGWAGLHDRLTSATVTVKRWTLKRAALLEARESAIPQIPQPCEYIGPFQLFGESRSWRGSTLYNGWDSELRRRVAILGHHSPETPELPPRRREAQRRGCLRWIMGARSGSHCWDAFEMPDGESLDALGPNSVPYAVHPSVLADLCDELAHNEEPDIDLRRVWISRNHRGILCDFPVASGAADERIVPRERLLHEAARALGPENPPPHAVGSILERLEASKSYPDAAASLRGLTLLPMSRTWRVIQLLFANAFCIIFTVWSAWSMWTLTNLRDLDELPAVAVRIRDTSDPSEKAMLARYARARFLIETRGLQRGVLQQSLRNVGIADAKERLDEIGRAAPATPAEIAANRPLVRKLVAAAPSGYAKIQADVTLGDALELPAVLAFAQFAVGLLASLLTGAPISFWLTGLALTNAAGAAASWWRVAVRSAIPVVLTVGTVWLASKMRTAAPLPVMALLALAVTLWQHRRGPVEKLLGLWISPR